MTARRGLTLVELVVAITVGALAISVGYAAFGTLVDHRNTADDATRATMRSYAVRQTISDWLAGARLDATSPQLGAFRGLSGENHGLPDDELTFVTTAPSALGEGDATIRLFIARDRSGRALGLSAEITEWRGTRRETVMLDSAVAGLRVGYRTSVFATSTAWAESWVSTTVLPRGVMLTLHPAPKDSVAALLREPLVVALEGGR